MTPSLEQFKALLAAAETGSFSAAARRLGKAQSVVSTAIANLEIDLGLELFDRSGRYPVLTEAGAASVKRRGCCWPRVSGCKPSPGSWPAA